MLLKSMILAFFCSFVSIILHLVISFFRKGRLENEPEIFELSRQWKLLFSLWMIFFLVYASLFFWQAPAINSLITRVNAIIPALDFIYGIFLYLMLSFMYLSFYYFINRSVSATILELIENSADKKLTEEQIKNLYNIENKYRSEIKGMLDGRFIIQESGYYRNALKGKIFAHLANFMKSYLKLGPGG